MKKRLCRSMAIVLLMFSVAVPSPVKADFFGGDLPLLMQIIVNTLQQLAQLRAILGNAQDTLGLLRDVNEGIREAMGIMRTMNTTIQAGVFSQFQNPEQVLRAIQDVYGMIPHTADSKMEQLTDQSVAEAITLHNQAFAYAAQVDPEAERIKDYSRDVSPAGAGKLTAQSLGVLIHVTNQVLRTNAAMLKLLSQNLALQNRKEKINSQQFKMQYDGISSAMKSTASFKSMSNLGQ